MKKILYTRSTTFKEDNKMTFDERIDHINKSIEDVQSDIIMLQMNLDELKSIVKDIKTEDDFKKLDGFDLEKGLSMITIL